MKFFTQLFDSLWREHGDGFSRARQNRHYDSMAEQVMANRNEVLHLQGELDRVSHDLSQAMTLNRTLVKLLLSEGVGTPEKLEQLLGETLLESRLELGENEAPSRFCEDCGRPLAHPGRSCAYCTELALRPTVEEENPAQTEGSEAVQNDSVEEDAETDQDLRQSSKTEESDTDREEVEDEPEEDEAPKAKKRGRSGKKKPSV